MKLKNLFITLGLSLALGIGVGVGIGFNKEFKAAKADITEDTLYIDFSESFWVKEATPGITDIKAQIWGGANGDVYFYSGGSGWSTIEISSKTYVALNMTGNKDFTGMQVYCWDYSGNGNISVGISPSSFSDGKNLIKVGDSGSWTTKQPVTFDTLEVGTTYTVTKYAVYDGVLDSEHPLGSDDIAEGGSYAVPARVNKTGYHFAGWFTTSACTVAYTATTVNANMSVYAKYVSLSKDSYIYYITDSSSATNNSIHSWGGDFELDGLITSVSGVQEVHGVTRFRNTDYLIYKIPFSSEAGDTAFKFHYNNWESQSSEKTLVAGNAYQWGEGEIATDEAAGGDALDFILRVEAIRNAVVAAGNIKAYSVCGISAENASALCSAYNGLSATARGYVDASYTYTYKRTDASQNDNVSFYDIMEQLAAQAGGAALTGHSSRAFIAQTTQSNTAILLVVIISATALVAVGGFFLLKKKKHN